MKLYGKTIYQPIFDHPEEHEYELIQLAETYNLSGNLWQNFIAWVLMNDENPFSLSFEKRMHESTSVEKIAVVDLEEFRISFFGEQSKKFKNYIASDVAQGQNAVKGKMVMQFAEQLSHADSLDMFVAKVKSFYVNCGVGFFGLNKAFYLDDHGQIQPVSDFRSVSLHDLWGYELQKRQLDGNTKAFVTGKAANNVLLYGDNGTGKSTGVKAMLNKYYVDGLRIIQIQKYQFEHLPAVIAAIRNRNYSFILFMDDLSFEQFEVEYKYLKALIEGGMEERPSNVLIYATSNRRHLIKETFDERDDNDLHRNETVQERKSLSDRFGLQICYTKPLQNDYFSMVLFLRDKYKLSLSDDDAIAGARRWGIEHGGFSGRAAEQYIKHMLFQTK